LKTKELREVINNMEKKKLLLVAVSVGVVLLMILIIPLLIISPRKDFGSSWQEQSAVIEPPNLTQGWESVRETEQQPVEEVAVAPVTTSKPAANVTTITVPAPRSGGVPDVEVSPVRPASRARQVQAEAPKEPAAKPAAVKPVKPAAEKPAVKPAAKPGKAFDSSNFWIQTGAFSTIKYAEGAKDYLAARGITSVIEDPVINGKTWYRVRVGPYTTRDEANYWLALVKSIDGFSASQVWEAR
jgi:DedD protein